MSWAWFHRFGSPPYFYRVAGLIIPWLAWPAGLLIAAGLFDGLVLAPPDYQQSDAVRIMYVHVPSAWLSLMAYSLMAAAAAVGLIWNMKVAHAVAAACAPIGATFAAAGLATGMLWGEPMWGTYWAWDPRLVFELVLFFFFLGYMGLRSAIDDISRADRISAVLAIVGVVNVPLVHYSVIWWNSLHQGPSIIGTKDSSYQLSMLIPLLASFLGFTLYFYAVMLVRARAEVLRRDRGGSWVREALSAQEKSA